MKTVISLFLFALWQNPAWAQDPAPSKCVDREGRILITDEPCSTYKKPLGPDRTLAPGDKSLVEIPLLPTPTEDLSATSAAPAKFQSAPTTPAGRTERKLAN